MKSAFVLFELMNHMALVLKAARLRGFEIIVLNHNPVSAAGPYGVPAELIDHLIHIDSWQDGAEVHKVIAEVHRQYRIVGTYAGFEATLPYEAALRELAGLANNGAENVRFVLDKAAVRKKLYHEGLSELNSVLLSEARAWTAWQFNRPAVLKPVNGTGSALCFLVGSISDLHAAMAKVDSAAVVNPLTKGYIKAGGEFVLEEQAAGELLSVESMVYQGKVHFIGLTSRYVLAADPVVEMGSSFPYQHPRLAEIVAKSAALHQCMKIFHGPTHLELMVPKDGPIELIDFNIRFAGVESLICFNHAFAIEFEECLVDLSCEREPDLSFLERPAKVAAELMLLPRRGVTEFDELVFPPEAVFQRLTKEPGKALSGSADQLDHIGVFVVKADTQAELHRKVLDARWRVRFNGQALADDANNVVAFSEFMNGQPPQGD